MFVKKEKLQVTDKVDFTDFDMLECLQQDASDESTGQQESNADEFIYVPQLKCHHDLVYRKFALVCTELKLLYVAITRPKNFLLIYDDDATFRKPI